MVKHIVCFKLKDNSYEACLKAKEVLMNMEGRVPQLVSINVGIDFLHSERSYDVILEVVVKTKEELDAYQKDEYHVNVVKPYMHSVRLTSVAVDYEF